MIKGLRQLKSGDKVKMKLVQPAIKCSGRSDVVCYFKGVVTGVFSEAVGIDFKYKGVLDNALYTFEEGFLSEDKEDIKIIKIIKAQ